MSGRIITDTHPEAHPLTSNQASIVRHNWTTILKLPDPREYDGTWTSHDLDAIEKYERPTDSTLKTLISNDVIMAKGMTKRNNKTNCPLRKFEVIEAAYERAEQYVGELTTLPCCDDGTGFTNLGNSKFACTSCGETHPRSVIEEVFC